MLNERGGGYRGHFAIGVERRVDGEVTIDAVAATLFGAGSVMLWTLPSSTLAVLRAPERVLTSLALAMIATVFMVRVLRAPRWLLRFDPSSRVLEARTDGLWPRSRSRVVIEPGSSLVREYAGNAVFLRLEGVETIDARVTAPLSVHCFATLADFVRAIEAVPSDAPHTRLAPRSPRTLRSALSGARLWAAILALWLGWSAWIAVAAAALLR